MRLVPVRDSSKLYAGCEQYYHFHYYESHYKCVVSSMNLINHPQKESTFTHKYAIIILIVQSMTIKL